MMTSTPMTSLFAAALLPLPLPCPTLSVPVCLFICLTFRCYASLFYFLVARQLIAAETTTTTATTQNEIKSSDEAASAAWAKVEIPFNAQWPRPLFPHYSHTYNRRWCGRQQRNRGRRQQATLVNASRVNFDYTHTQEGKQTCACLCVCVCNCSFSFLYPMQEGIKDIIKSTAGRRNSTELAQNFMTRS